MSGARLKLLLARPFTPDSGGSYPLGVIAAGLQAVYDLKTTAGPTQSALITLPGGAASVPVTISGDDAQTATSGTVTAARAQFTGYDLQARGTCVVALTQPRLGNSGGRVAQVQDTASLTITDGEIDAAGAANAFSGAITAYEGTEFAATNTKWVNAPMMFLRAYGPDFVITSNYFGSYGLNPYASDSHLEAIQVDGGTGGIHTSRFEPGSDPPSMGGHTAPLYYEDYLSNVDHEIRDVIIGWTGSPGIPASVQAAAKNGRNVTLRVSGSVLKMGTSAYVVPSQISGVLTIIDEGGNYDYDTGAPINVSFP